MLLLIIQLSGARVLEEYQASEVRPSETFQDLGKTLPRNEKSVKNSTSTFIEAGGEETRQTIESEEENRAPTVPETTTEASTTTKIIDQNKATDEYRAWQQVVKIQEISTCQKMLLVSLSCLNS